jgi:hypothetical protein
MKRVVVVWLKTWGTEGEEDLRPCARLRLPRLCRAKIRLSERWSGDDEDGNPNC